MPLTAYVTTWGKDPIVQIQDMINKSALKSGTRIILSFASFNFTSSTYIPGLDNMTLDKVKNFTTLVHSQNCNVSLSIGGATYPFYGSDLYTQPGVLASNINELLNLCSFDGVDFDIEDNYTNVPSDFASNTASLINTLRYINNSLYISLTTPCQAWGAGMYQQSLLNMTFANLHAWQPMEYDLWVDSKNTFTEQIISDINFYINNWGVDPCKIVLGLMPGSDDMGHILTLQDALNLTQFAKDNKLRGVMIWDANIDSVGVDGNAPYAYTMGISSMLTVLPPPVVNECCIII